MRFFFHIAQHYYAAGSSSPRGKISRSSLKSNLRISKCCQTIRLQVRGNAVWTALLVLQCALSLRSIQREVTLFVMSWNKMEEAKWVAFVVLVLNSTLNLALPSWCEISCVITFTYEATAVVFNDITRRSGFSLRLWAWSQMSYKHISEVNHGHFQSFSTDLLPNSLTLHLVPHVLMNESSHCLNKITDRSAASSCWKSVKLL